MKTDSLFYRLFQTLPQLFFDLIERSSADAAQYRFESVELKQPDNNHSESGRNNFGV
jgi:predicted transposase YdaD